MQETTEADRAALDTWERMVAASGSLGLKVLEHDWAATPLGPIELWPENLRTVAGLCLSSRFPMMLAWGPDLIQIYNDGYEELLGADKAGRALGAPASEIWAEVWDTIGPLYGDVLAGRGATWSADGRLMISRNGFIEECFFTYSYSPVLNPADGTVDGVLDIVTETTAQVLNRRRFNCLGALGAALVGAADVAEACNAAVNVLVRFSADVPVAKTFLDTGGSVLLLASSRRHGLLDATNTMLVRNALAAWEPAIHDSRSLFVEPPANCNKAMLLPIGIQGAPSASGVLILGISPRQTFGTAYREFFELVAASVSAAIASAFHRSSQLDQHRFISETLQKAMLGRVDHLGNVAVRYLPAVGHLSVGGDWYEVVELDEQRLAIIVGDCVGHGLEAATVMGQLRSVSRALVLDGESPSQVLNGLDRFAATTQNAECTTVFCGIVDRRAGTFTYSSAGHLPPLLVGRSGDRWLDGALGVPLAVGLTAVADRLDVTTALEAGDTIVLYTDGLIERRRRSLDDGLADLRRVVTDADGASLTVEKLADRLINSLGAAAAADDVALVVYRAETID